MSSPPTQRIGDGEPRRNGTGAGFFASPQPASVLKHGVIRRYSPIYASKLGYSSPSNRVGIADCFAGAGEYDDGTPGSAAILAKLAADLKARNTNSRRHLECFYIEAHQETYRRLARVLDGYPHSYALRKGHVQKLIPELLMAFSGIPALFFLDPFGSLPPLRTIADDLLDRDGATSEVILNFMLPNLRRKAGWLHNAEGTRGREATIMGLNTMLGGSWWHEIAREWYEGWEIDVRDGYLERLQNRAGCHAFTVPVTDGAGGPILYYLILLTRSDHGLWFFNEAVSYAQRRFHEYSLEGSLFGPPDDMAFLTMQARANIKALCESRKMSFRLRESIDELYEGILGRANARNVKAALDDLKKAGMIDWQTARKGNLFYATVTPVSLAEAG